jgi:methionyl-tRNA formyltransferase
MSPVDWNKPAKEIINKIYGFIPWPVATLKVGGVTLKIYGAECCENKENKKPGEIIGITKQGLEIACFDGAVRITELQAPGGKRMKSIDYFRGHPLC